MPERLYTTYQVADLLGATPSLVVEWMQKGWLPFRRLPDGPVRISEKDLVRFLKGRGVNIEEVLAKAVRREGERRQGGSTVAAGSDRRADEPVVDYPAETDSVQNAAPEEQPDHVVREQLLSPQPEAEEPPSQTTSGAGDVPVKESAFLPDEAGAEHQVEVEPTPLTGETPVPPSTGETPAPEESPQPVEAPSAAPAESVQQADLPAVSRQVAEAILRDALARGATDIHLHPAGDELVLRLRIDGVLQEKLNFSAKLPKGLSPHLIERFKLLAGLDTDETRRPQSGKLSFEDGERTVEFRLSVLPTTRGESLTIRVSPAGLAAPSLDRLPLEAEQRSQLRPLLNRPWGLIIVAGTPREGRSAALRAILAEVDGRGRNVVAIDKDSAGELPDVSHALVDPSSGAGFAELLVSMSDHDADVVLVGDLRDPASSLSALELALDGRLVLAGMLSGSASEAVATLLAMGLEPWPLASALSAVVAMRTVRRLCDECKKRIDPPADVLAAIGLDAANVDFPLFDPVGCRRCGSSGYFGTVGMMSVMRGGLAVSAAIRDRADVEEIRRAGASDGLRPIGELALAGLRAGQTTAGEIAGILHG